MQFCQSNKVLKGTKFQVTQGGMSFLLKIPGNQSGLQGVRSEFLISEFLWHQIMRPLQVSSMLSANSLREKQMYYFLQHCNINRVVSKIMLWNICTSLGWELCKVQKLKVSKLPYANKHEPQNFCLPTF